MAPQPVTRASWPEADNDVHTAVVRTSQRVARVGLLVGLMQESTQEKGCALLLTDSPGSRLP